MSTDATTIWEPEFIEIAYHKVCNCDPLTTLAMCHPFIMDTVRDLGHLGHGTDDDVQGVDYSVSIAYNHAVVCRTCGIPWKAAVNNRRYAE